MSYTLIIIPLVYNKKNISSFVMCNDLLSAYICSDMKAEKRDFIRQCLIGYLGNKFDDLLGDLSHKIMHIFL